MPPDSDPALPVPTKPHDGPAYLSETWLNLDWSPWVPFDASREFFYIPKEPGVYRIRPAGKDCLMYIGETGQTLHKKLAGFRQALRRGDLMPWSDPHEAASCLWAYWVEWARSSPPADTPKNSAGAEEAPEQAGRVMFEFSAAPLDASPAGRKGMASFLLYRYRLERGESPACNFGRFHPRYRKSTSRAEGHRGGKLKDDQQDNPAGFPGIEPLEPAGKPGDSDWMGLEWTDWQDLTEEQAGTVAPGAGLYLLAQAGLHEVVYIGQSADVARQLAAHARKNREEMPLQFSYQIIGQSVLPHNLRELEADCIGNFFEQNRKAPEFQFRTGR